MEHKIDGLFKRVSEKVKLGLETEDPVTTGSKK
jgi:hypothetical protein